MSKYRVALMGCGRVGCGFKSTEVKGELIPANHADAFAALPNCELVAAVSRGKERLREFGESYGVKALYHDYSEMLRKENPDIVCVATHPELHAEMVIASAEAGTKGIICEKPMALDLGECDRMIAACDEAGAKLLINHNRRWDNGWIKAKELLDSGAIGELNHVIVYCQGAKPDPSWVSEHEGPLLHDVTHFFDMMRFYAGEVDWLCAMAERRRQPWRVEDASLAMFKFKSGATGLLWTDELSNYCDFGVELRGSDGMVQLGRPPFSVWRSVPDGVFDHEDSDRGFTWRKLQREAFPEYKIESTYVLAAKELIEAIEKGTPIRSDGGDGRAAIEIIMSIYESQRRGCSPVCLPLGTEEVGLELMRREGLF